MKRLFIVDSDDDFVKQVKTLCVTEKLDIQVFSSSKDALISIDPVQPHLVFVGVDIPGLNMIIMHDILKKCVADYSIPIYVFYQKKSEKKLKKLSHNKYKPQEELEKPVEDSQLEKILLGHFGRSLVKVKNNVETGGGTENLLENLFISADGTVESKDKASKKESNKSSKGKEINLADLPEFQNLLQEKKHLEVEVKNLSKEVEDLEKEMESRTEDFSDKLKELKTQKKNEIQQLTTEYKDKIKELKKDNENLEKEKTGNDHKLAIQVESFKEELSKKEEELQELKEVEIYQRRTLKTLEEKNESLSTEVNTLKGEVTTLIKSEESLKESQKKLKEELDQLIQEKEVLEKEYNTLKEKSEKREALLISSVDKLKKDIETASEDFEAQKEILQKLSGLLKDALNLIPKSS